MTRPLACPGDPFPMTRRALLARVAGAVALATLAPAARAAGPADGDGASGLPARLLPFDGAAAAQLKDLPGKAVFGAAGAEPLITELVDYNAADWRRSALDMRALLAGDPGLGYALVQTPRFDVRSLEAARISLSVLAAASSRFEEFYLALARGEGPIDGLAAVDVAHGMGLDRVAVFNGSIVPERTEELSQAAAFASTLRVLDTPAYVIGGNAYEGYLDLDRKRALIAEARAAQAPL